MTLININFKKIYQRNNKEMIKGEVSTFELFIQRESLVNKEVI